MVVASPSDADRRRVAERLGRSPRGRFDIAVRDAQGMPLVLINHPVLREAVSLEPDGPNEQAATIVPFPTLYWLCCPRLSAALSELERRGVITEAEQALRDDRAMREAMLSDHQRYITQRWSLLSAKDIAELQANGMLDALQKRGIGGMAMPASCEANDPPLAVKCLHMHYAQHLVDGNTIGDWLDRCYGVSASVSASNASRGPAPEASSQAST